jgi:excisionase family DNA binding protein
MTAARVFEFGRMLSTDEVASILGVRAEDVRELVRARELPAFKIGRRVRIKDTDLRDYLWRHQIAAPEPVQRVAGTRAGRTSSTGRGGSTSATRSARRPNGPSAPATPLPPTGSSASISKAAAELREAWRSQRTNRRSP